MSICINCSKFGACKLASEEIKDIIKEEFRNEVQRNIQKNGISTLIANIGYKNVFNIINNEIPKYENQVKEKTKEVIENLSSYCVFRKKDLIDQEDSLGQKYLEEAIRDNKNIINKKVVDIFNELGKQDISYEISSIIEDKINEMFIGGNKEE